MLARLGAWVDEHERAAFGGVVAFYLAVVLAQASLKLVWADELITFYISRQPGFTGIWKALQAGADPNPPLMHVLVKVSTAALGGNAVGMRVPAILCVLLAIVAMWWMLRRWVRPTFALVGVLAFMATRGFDYAYDARSYAPMMGFAMASLALWMWSGDVAGWRRYAALAGMALALALGISSNYYCVLAFFPIAVGEIVARRWRPGVWVAMGVASLPLIAYLPLIRHNIAEFGPHAWNRPQVSMVAMSYLELVEGIFWPVVGLGVVAWWKRRKANREGAEVSRRGTEGFRGEMAALVVLLIYPFLGFAVAVGGAGMISPRCVAPVCCGIGLVAGLLGQRMMGTSRQVGMALVLGLVVWVGVREGICAQALATQSDAFFRLRDHAAKYRTEVKLSTGKIKRQYGMPLAQDSGVILVGDSSFVLPLYFYSDAYTRSRILFPVDFAAIHRVEREDSGEQNLWAGRNGVFPFRIVPLDSLDLTQPEIVVIARPDGWLAQSVRGKDVALTVDGEQEVFWGSDWSSVGGVFTPMAHEETRMLGGN